jgi:two-component system response regulator FlrC
VLINGPTGTGKEVLSRFIHDRSARADKPFIAINCAAMPEAMLEAMLFGHQKGAFTGANAAGEGFFRAADGARCCSTRSPRCRFRCRLLRALQERKSFLGATHPVKVDVRIIACANRDLPRSRRRPLPRRPLYRLNVFPLMLRPLCERPDDIAPLAFAMVLRHVAPGMTIPWIGEAALRCCRPILAGQCPRTGKRRAPRPCFWPGMPERSGLSTSCSTVRSGSRRNRADRSRAGASLAGNGHANGKLSNIVQMSEARVILATLEACGGNRLAAARQLGISERTLRYRLASFREAGIAVAGGRR